MLSTEKVSKPWVCYLICAEKTSHTYIGSSNDAVKRLHNHNTNKGAKRTKGQTWFHVLVIEGFDCKQSCLSFEAGWKRLHKTRNNSRFDALYDDSSIELKYTDHLIWNRLLDLLYFTHNFSFVGTKFILNKKIRCGNKPDQLIINCHCFGDFVEDLDWPDFIQIHMK